MELSLTFLHFGLASEIFISQSYPVESRRDIGGWTSRTEILFAIHFRAAESSRNVRIPRTRARGDNDGDRNVRKTKENSVEDGKFRRFASLDAFARRVDDKDDPGSPRRETKERS